VLLIHIELPEDVRYIISSLKAEGHEAYAVGGCVRDCLLNTAPKDWDITTSAFPDDVKRIFPRTIDTGIKHGTVTVMLKGTGYEVTTYRVDGEYLDGRHPENVSFTGNLDEDLKRRDFTINAFVYSDETGVKDLFGGLDDLKNGIIRCVGNPEERFGEDALRILRAIRFAAKLGFEVEPETYRACIKLRQNLSKVSSERIKAELDKILVSPNPGHISVLREMGISQVIMPELDRADISGLSAALERAEAELPIRWAVLCFFLARSDRDSASELMRRLKFDNRTRDRVLLFIRIAEGKLPVPRDPEFRKACRILINHTGKEDVFAFLSFCEALSAAFPVFDNDYETILQEIKDIFEKKECTSLKELAVNGRDILEISDVGGAEIGRILEALLRKVMDEPELNRKEELLKLVPEMAGS
jgi:tRNA nucleotidyltransferase (CCA-adding enzyme)